ncbi:ABC transporter permease subunit [Candidatus Pantoea multigeneris]|uniref:ABC transporter permease subunit n=1 Tax=Candidatus Pantoea multigeneris TaxID=2608357 RepID=A0ABX0R6E6_9GAMM|nr:ABC transporter permease subunit [Pantoea multigeneris]NIF20975.1 ABC transporter permease subunit [Pantoea multigeneris]
MSLNHIPVHYSDRRRRWLDSFARRLISSCGMAILLLMMLLFFWLIWVVLPLFSSPSLHQGQAQALQDKSPLVALGNSGSVGWRIGASGNAALISLDKPSTGSILPLNAAIQSATVAADQQSMLLRTAQGVLLLQVDTTPAQAQWRFPLGDKPLSALGNAGQPLSLAKCGPDCWRMAQVNAQGIQVITYRDSDIPDILNIPQRHADKLLLSPRGTLLYTLDGQLLRVWSFPGTVPHLREIHTLPRIPQSLHLLSGGESLLIQDATGISQWFAISGEQGPRLREIHRYAESSGDALLFTEINRRVFATLNAEGEFKLFASKQDGPIMQRKLEAGVAGAAFSPNGDALLLERAGSWQRDKLDDPWPDVNWRNFWQKIWYENYPKPDWVWQSTAAGDSYQAKFSLVPMVTGTLKAAGLALLFATPLALAAAMYTAWFMSPGMRRWIKPAIEMMGALPSVVVGLIAGLWMAPHIGDALPGVLLLPVTLTITLLLCGRFGKRWQRAGRELLVLLPILLAVALLTLWLPSRFLPDVSIWLPHYAQRNLLVASLAMGFALIPLIFTLAEDALFSVPASLGQGSLALGATPWQTLTRVVLPGASAGIFAAMMIGFGRAIGETMILLMASGNTPQTSGGLFSGLRALSANIAIEMPEAASGSAHYRILFLSALVLLVFTLVINTLAELIRQRLRQRYSQHEGQG